MFLEKMALKNVRQFKAESTMKIQKRSCSLVSIAALLTLMLSISATSRAQDSPTITIKNESSETVLARLRGTSSGALSIPGGGSRTISVRGGNYLALFRYGNGGRRYTYTKVGPFQVVESANEVSEITIVLHTVVGNTQEQPSSEREFEAQ